VVVAGPSDFANASTWWSLPCTAWQNAMTSPERSDSRMPRTSSQNLTMRGTSGVKRSTCASLRGRTCATLLRAGAAPWPGGTGATALAAT
jgi:hypothetical protein